ncbi:MAG: Rpn family recombination-promoting nuclease/putative transposase [SAR324 cluster bacterium]|nr:Rpn family recombination-promoting nuclease/putative transposase [SAR324 cluster bacterium]
MKHFINPLIDCVFKAILGDPEHKGILLHFLNSILKLENPILEVEILNPYNAKEFLSDKLTVVDVKAQDSQGRLYQIEVQLTLDRCLGERMLYNWSVLYKKQIDEGENYNQLCPVIAIWLLDGIFFSESPAVHHHFQVYDAEHRFKLSEHCSIHVLELPKWKKPEDRPLDPENAWLYFFEEAQHWKELPEELQTINALEEAMNVLKRFAEKDADYWLYEARLEGLRLQRYRESEMKRMEQEKVRMEQDQLRMEQERNQLSVALEQALQQKEDAQKREERLMELLKKAGIDPAQ